MTAAGVQPNDSAAYLPPPPSNSTPDAKGSNAAGKPTADAAGAGAQDGPSDFHRELKAQQSGSQPAETKSSAKADSGKSGKKRNVPAEDDSPSVVTPVQAAEPQKAILPFALALVQPQELAPQQENGKPDPNATLDEKATTDEIAQGSASQPGQGLLPSLTDIAQTEIAQLPALEPAPVVKQSLKGRQSVQPSATPNQAAASNSTPAAVTDPGKTLVLPFMPAPMAANNIPMRPEGKKSDDAAQDQAVTSAKPGTSDAQPASLADLKLAAVPAEPIASAVQGSTNSAPSGPSALAFAARISAAQTKADVAAAAPPQTPVPSPAVSGSQTSVEIPMRYAATAQIIQSAALGTHQDGPKKDEAFLDRPARAEARADTMLPQFETVSQPSASSGSAAPQQTAPTAPTESVIEPPAAPPTSSHDIRVRVPDNNGGSTQLRFLESGGEVRVSVRTADEGLAQNLRTHLNDLTQRLSDGGMPAEMWKPVSTPTSSSQSDSHQPNHQDGRGSGGQGSGGHGGQQDRQQKRPAWLDEMEASLKGEQN